MTRRVIERDDHTFLEAMMPAKKKTAAPKARQGMKDLRPKQEVRGGKLMGEILSNVSKTRSEISQTFARNSRG